MPMKVCLLSGEPSGAAIAARLMVSLRRAVAPGHVQFCGVAGTPAVRQGLNSLFPAEELAVMGFVEVVPHIWRTRKRIKQTVAFLREERPDVIVAIDSKGFNFRVLNEFKTFKESHQRVYQYVAPSVWSLKGREETPVKLNDLVDHMFCVLPFEPYYFRKARYSCTFVGHPAFEQTPLVIPTDIEPKDGKFGAKLGIATMMEKSNTDINVVADCIASDSAAAAVDSNAGSCHTDDFRSVVPLDEAENSRLYDVAIEFSKQAELHTVEQQDMKFTPHQVLERLPPTNMGARSWLANRRVIHETGTLGLFPGSRLQEVEKALPVMHATVKQLVRESPERIQRAILPCTPNVESMVRDMLARYYWPIDVDVVVMDEDDGGANVHAGRHQTFSRCEAALAVSGTVVTELALCAVPTVVMYRAHWLTGWIAKYLALVRHVSIPNIMADTGDADTSSSLVIHERIFSDCTPDSVLKDLRCLLDRNLENKAAAQDLIDEQIERMVLWDSFSEQQQNTQKGQVTSIRPLPPSQVAAAIILQEHNACLRSH